MKKIIIPIVVAGSILAATLGGCGQAEPEQPAVSEGERQEQVWEGRGDSHFEAGKFTKALVRYNKAEKQRDGTQLQDKIDITEQKIAERNRNNEVNGLDHLKLGHTE